MKKKVCLGLILIAIVLCFTGCYADSPTVISYKDANSNDYFITIRECGSYNMDGYGIDLYEVYAKDTHVKYLIGVGHYRQMITPLYNADGTLQIYEGE